ncbi:MAG TPA: hypothetical protein VMS43_15745 [Allosphingosinicella sp.]|nr:hypothetical protein [Allosphingosinicella sp.]
MRQLGFAALALGLAAPALAVQPPAAPAPPPAAARPSPRPAAEVADPARLAAAERLVALIMPEDAMRRMLSQGMPGLTAAAMEMSPEDLGVAETMGVREADRGRSLAELGSTHDPHFRERMRISVRVSGEVMAEMMAEVMPEMNRAYANYFARRLTLAELNELIGVFSTPTARKYTDMWLGVSEDPAFLEMMRAMMPRMMEAASRLDERTRAATAHLPPAPGPPAAPDAAGANEDEE